MYFSLYLKVEFYFFTFTTALAEASLASVGYTYVVDDHRTLEMVNIIKRKQNKSVILWMNNSNFF